MYIGVYECMCVFICVCMYVGGFYGLAVVVVVCAVTF